MPFASFSTIGQLSLCRILVVASGLLFDSYHANVGQLLLTNGPDERMPNVVHKAHNVSILSCGKKCTRSTVCLSVSYHRTSRTCELSSSSGHDTGVARISAPGWTIYRQKYDCPNSPLGFIKVGTMRLKLCPELVTLQKATAACSQFGRLVKIDTVAKMGAIIEYLTNHPNDVWVNGYLYPDDTWQFDDRTLVPTCGDPDFWAVSATCLVDPCVRLKQGDGFKMNDKACDSLFSYMCEML